MLDFLTYASQNLTPLGQKTWEQTLLVFISIFFATLIGLPLGLLIARRERLQAPVMGIVNILYTIPSLAMLALLLPFFGIGIKPAIVALTLYALLPIVRNTFLGITGIPEQLLEAARGLGFTNKQRLLMVELPLALPVLVGGIRTATTITVGIATLAAFIGAGGLGDFINQGLTMNNTNMILLGAIPAAIMAITFDFILSRIEQSLQGRHHLKLKPVLITAACLALITLISINLFTIRDKNTIRVASKNFTEQIILGEMISQMLEAHTKLHVKRYFNLGTTDICQAAMEKGDIDIYPEYTGTALLLILKEPYAHQTADALFQHVSTAYKKKYKISWLQSFGFNNTEALVVKQSFAKQHQLNTISDIVALASTLQLGAPPEISARADGLPGLQKAYQIQFAKVSLMDPGLIYQAIRDDHVDAIMGFSTDGRIPAYQLQVLQDDKHFFPPYYAAPLIRDAVLKQHPEVQTALAPLAHTLDDDKMQALNRAVDLEKKSPHDVAHQFLQQQGLV